jgi:putative Mg2+ transporter-C (MgtC) family protein
MISEPFEPTLHLSILQAVGRLGMALVLSAIIGWEREASGRAAGLRTHMLVALGAAGFTLTGIEFASAASDEGIKSADPIKIIEAIATGIGFLGAGAIIQSRGEVKGLTTAASIWVVAAVGMAAAAGYWLFALSMTGFALVTLTVLRWLEPRKPDKP